MKKTVLDNGLVILTKPVTTNSIVSVVVALGMGSLYESDEQAGLCTLMQDTILKGTTTRDSEQIAVELESMGTRLSSNADREYGTLTMQSTAQSLYPSLEVLYDIVLNPTFPDDIIDMQKKLQVSQIHVRYDQPIYRAMDLMVEAHYGDHPFHKPRLGYPETIDSFTSADTRAMYEALYVPDNMVVCAVGNFDEERFIRDVGAALGSLPGGRRPSPVAGDMPSHDSVTEKMETRQIAANWFALGWDAPPLDHPDSFAMEVLDSITGGSMNSRLFIAIREERGLAYQVSSFLSARKESGLYAAYIGTKPESYEEARSVLVEEVRRMAEEPATEEEVANARKFLNGMTIMSLESNSGQASRFAQHEIIGVGYDYTDRYLREIMKVDADDVLRVGREYVTGPYSIGGVLAE